jgi:hypothetical protein
MPADPLKDLDAPRGTLAGGVKVDATPVTSVTSASLASIYVSGDSYRLKDRDLGRVPAAAATDE